MDVENLWAPFLEYKFPTNYDIANDLSEQNNLMKEVHLVIPA
jgi:hypothetical protein